MRRVSMATRDELLVALAARYRGSGRVEKTRILDEFAPVTRHHHKHAMRLLRAGRLGQALNSRPERRVYHAAVREALIEVPGPSLSATMAAFSLSDHVRRRPAPVNSSRRRIGSDIAIRPDIDR